MLDLEKLEVTLAGYEKKGFEAEVRMTSRQIELTLRKRCDVRGKWYGMTRHLAWISVETCSFDLIEYTLNAIEVELVREALLDARPVPRYEDQVILREPVTGNDVFKPWPEHQGSHKSGLADK